MEPMSQPRAIIDYCLAPLNLEPGSEAATEARRRLEHAIKAFRQAATCPVAVDFSALPSAVINEAAHGYE